MKRYFIEDAKYGIAECENDWISGSPVAAIKYRTEDETKWMSVVDFCGTLNVYLTDEEIFTELLKVVSEDEEYEEYLGNQYIDEFNGITLATDYNDVYESIYDDLENPAVPLIKLLLVLLNGAEDDSTEELVSVVVGKYADELDLPVSEAEEEFLDELEDEDDEEEDYEV